MDNQAGFPDRTAPKIKPVVKKSPWDFTCPPYDERHSCYVNAGTDYGMGTTVPVGTMPSQGAKEGSAIPQGVRVSVFKSPPNHEFLK